MVVLLCILQSELTLCRVLQVLENIAYQMYYPAEHVVLFSDLGIISGYHRARWVSISLVLWALGLFTSMNRSGPQIQFQFFPFLNAVHSYVCGSLCINTEVFYYENSYFVSTISQAALPVRCFMASSQQQLQSLICIQELQQYYCVIWCGHSHAWVCTCACMRVSELMAKLPCIFICSIQS